MTDYLLPRLALTKDCTGCLACIDACSTTKALSYKLNLDGHWYPFVDKDKCIGCHLCEKVCPVVSNLPYSHSEECSFFACWSKDIEIRQKSATAGAFAAIASYVLDNGGVAIGAEIDGVCNVRHIVVTNKSDLYKLQGSKYTQSETKGIYQKTKQLLIEGKTVLFSGTGCQVAGLYSFLRNKKYNGHLITVDLVCGGMPSKHLLNKFLENEPYSIKRVLSFRTKEHGWKPRGFIYNLKTEDFKGVIHDYTGKRNLLTDGFSSEMTNRYSCYQCKFAGEYRMSDFTIGDLWGITDYPEQQYNGISLIIAHNKSSLNLLEKISDYLEIHKTDKYKAIQHNSRIKQTKSKQGKLLERRFMPWIMNHCSYSTIKKIYAWDYSNKSPWILFKILHKIGSVLLR